MTSNSITSNNIMTTSHQDHHDNNNYSAHGPRRAALSPEGYDMIKEAYCSNVSPFMTQAAALEIEAALENGFDLDTILLAINETGFAPRPSLFYLRAILRNWAESGVTVCKGSTNLVRTNNARPWWK